VVLLEAPHRIAALAQALAVLGERPITVGRELTKQFEQIATLRCDAFPAWLAADPQRSRGEFALVLHGIAQAAAPDDGERVLRLLLAELPVKTAVKLAAEITGGSRNELYEAALRIKQGSEMSGSGGPRRTRRIAKDAKELQGFRGDRCATTQASRCGASRPTKPSGCSFASLRVLSRPSRPAARSAAAFKSPTDPHRSPTGSVPWAGWLAAGVARPRGSAAAPGGMRFRPPSARVRRRPRAARPSAPAGRR
jgi:hypothetical protein